MAAMSKLHLSRTGGARRIGIQRAAYRSALLFLLLPAIFLWIRGISALATGSETPWQAPAAQAKVKNPISPNESSLAAGEKIYMKRCAACHGKTGNGDGHDAVDLGIHPA